MAELDSGVIKDRGIVTLVFKDREYRMARPDFGQLREYMTLNEKRVADEVALYSVWDDDETPAVPDDETPRQRDLRISTALLDSIRRQNAQSQAVLALRLEFWQHVAGIFGVDLPADIDRIEPWVGNAKLCDEVLEHWLDFPFRPRGDGETVS